MEPVAVLPSDSPGRIGARDFLPSVNAFGTWQVVAYETAAVAYYLAAARIAPADL